MDEDCITGDGGDFAGTSDIERSTSAECSFSKSLAFSSSEFLCSGSVSLTIWEEGAASVVSPGECGKDVTASLSVFKSIKSFSAVRETRAEHFENDDLCQYLNILVGKQC